VDIRGKRGDSRQGSEIAFMAFGRIIEMGYAPPRGDMEPKQVGELFGILLRVVVPPCPKGNEEVVVFIEGEQTMHHRGNANAGEGGELKARFLLPFVFGLQIAFPDAFDRFLERIGPISIFESVFPFVDPRRQKLAVFRDQTALDPGGSQFDAQRNLVATKISHFAILSDGCF
jgi:hypothetical protein